MSRRLSDDERIRALSRALNDCMTVDGVQSLLQPGALVALYEDGRVELHPQGRTAAGARATVPVAGLDAAAPLRPYAAEGLRDPGRLPYTALDNLAADALRALKRQSG